MCLLSLAVEDPALIVVLAYARGTLLICVRLGVGLAVDVSLMLLHYSLGLKVTVRNILHLRQVLRTKIGQVIIDFQSDPCNQVLAF